MLNIAVMGAGGKMGMRCSQNLKKSRGYKVLYVEIAPEAIARLEKQGIKVSPQDEALKQADVVILAVPDALISKICREIIHKIKSGAMIFGLDPAAGYAGVLPERKDITYFISHPCHAPLFSEEFDRKAYGDWFGGEKATQNAVCSLHQGPESDYAKGEAIARIIFAPIKNTHRVTTEQMAILEPGLVETLCLTCITIMKEAMDEVIRMGVPKPAVEDFIYGHIRTTIAIVFGFAGFPISDGARLAIEMARKEVFQPDWMKVLKPENVKKSVQAITHATEVK